MGFTRFYNRRHDRRGYFWGDRFKSVVVEDGNTLINCLAYIDLNPVRAGIVEKPEDYRWNAIGYHIQTENKDDFLSLDFGLQAFSVLDTKERIRRITIVGDLNPEERFRVYFGYAKFPLQGESEATTR